MSQHTRDRDDGQAIANEPDERDPDYWAHVFANEPAPNPQDEEWRPPVPSAPAQPTRKGNLHVVSGNESNGAGPHIDPELVAAAAAELDLDPTEARRTAIDLAQRIRVRQLTQLAATIVGDRAAAKDQRLDKIVAVTALDFLDETEEAARPLLGDLVATGHNATITAGFKAGKSTLTDNAAAALTSGGRFLGRFDTGRPRRVVLCNYELTRDDQRERLRALDLDKEAKERLAVLNLRGVGLCITTPAGRKRLTSEIIDHGAEVVIIDTYGAASAPSLENENDNAGARRFLNTFDQILADANCPSSLVTAHTGRKTHEEGAEHARGATVIDDWADVRIILTKDRDSGVRYLASEGRGSYDLPESALRFDPATRGLWLPDGDIGLSRSARRDRVAVDAVTEAVREQPGLNTTELKAALADRHITNSDAKVAAIGSATLAGTVHSHTDGRMKRYQLGASHDETSPCGA